MEEIAGVAKKLRNGRACGLDNIPNEFLKQGGELLHSHITSLFNTILEYEYTPSIWRSSITLMKQKKVKISPLIITGVFF